MPGVLTRHMQHPDLTPMPLAQRLAQDAPQWRKPRPGRQQPQRTVLPVRVIMQRPTPELAQAQFIANPQGPGLVTESPWPLAIDMKLQQGVFTRQACQGIRSRDRTVPQHQMLAGLIPQRPLRPAALPREERLEPLCLFDDPPRPFNELPPQRRYPHRFAQPVEQQRAALPWNWVTFPEFLDSVDAAPKAVNVLPYVPVSPLLIWVMGFEAAKAGKMPTPAQHAEMKRLLGEAMDAGAYLLGLWGLPMPIVEAVGFHLQPQRSNTRSFWVTGAVHVALALVNGEAVDEDYLQRANVLHKLPEWREHANALMGLSPADAKKLMLQAFVAGVFEGAEHEENAWAARLPEIFGWLLARG